MFSPSGVFLLILAVLIPFIPLKVRKDPVLFKSMVVVVAINQLITFLQITVGPLPTVDADPIAFNSYASYTGAEHLSGNSYVNFLRSVYDTLGGSHLLGCEINQIGFSLALVCFVEILYILNYQGYAPRLVLIFGLLPSVLLNSSVVLREGLQMAGFLGLVLGLLCLRHQGVTRESWLIAVGAIALVNLQNGFAPYLVLVLPVAMLWALGSRSWLIICTVSAGLFVVTFFGGRIVKALEARSSVVQQVMQGDGLEYIGGYQGRVNQGRSDFAAKLDMSSPAALLKTGPIVALQYLFAPMPWQVRGTLDLYGLFESLARLVLFGFAIREIWMSEGKRRQELLFLFGMFISIELVWSAGTSNWGTAFRHRVVAWGILVALGGPGALSALRFRVDSGVKEGAAMEVLENRPRSVRQRRRLLGKRRVHRNQERT